jgi:hypothetical protein
VSQALAEKQLRKSGVNFFTEEGRLGSTGRNLEKFLNQFNRTVYPAREVRLDSEAVVPQATSPFISVYNTELTQCFPGKGSKSGDRAPNETEIATCLRQKFLEREVELLKPKLLILMGDKSRQAFYKYLVKKPRTDTLQAHMDRIVSSGRIPKHQVGPLRVSVLPIQHASGANPNFYRMLENIPLIQLIRGLLALS